MKFPKTAKLKMPRAKLSRPRIRRPRAVTLQKGKSLGTGVRNVLRLRASGVGHRQSMALAGALLKAKPNDGHADLLKAAKDGMQMPPPLGNTTPSSSTAPSTEPSSAEPPATETPSGESSTTESESPED